MTYDPAFASFIIVGVVGGLAAFLNASSDWEISSELSRATDRWTAPVVTRRYRNDATADERVSREAEVLGGHGYRAALRRTASGGIMTGADPGETILVTYQLS